MCGERFGSRRLLGDEAILIRRQSARRPHLQWYSRSKPLYSPSEGQMWLLTDRKRLYEARSVLEKEEEEVERMDTRTLSSELSTPSR